LKDRIEELIQVGQLKRFVKDEGGKNDLKEGILERSKGMMKEGKRELKEEMKEVIITLNE